MEWTSLLVAVIFVLLGLGCLVLVVAGLPGTWIMIGLATAIELLDHHYLDGPVAETFGWRAIGACAALALLGEVLEAGAGAAGTRAGGGSRRGMVGSMIGGLVGAIVFTPLIPVPVVGTLIGALVGTFAGAAVAERTADEPPDAQSTLKAASGATLGRLLGTVSKTMIATTVWVVLSVGAFWR
jgi:uncharacterized protein YqgC (DUF456 family)